MKSRPSYTPGSTRLYSWLYSTPLWHVYAGYFRTRPRLYSPPSPVRTPCSERRLLRVDRWRHLPAAARTKPSRHPAEGEGQGRGRRQSMDDFAFVVPTPAFLNSPRRLFFAVESFAGETEAEEAVFQLLRARDNVAMPGPVVLLARASQATCPRATLVHV